MNDYDMKFSREVGKRLAEIAREQQRENEYRKNQQAAQHSVQRTSDHVCPMCGLLCGDKPMHIMCDPASR